MKDTFIEVHYGDNVIFLINLAKAYAIDPLSVYDALKDDEEEFIHKDGIHVWWEPIEKDSMDHTQAVYYGISYAEVRKLLTGKP